MNTTELITTTRESAGIGDAAAYIDYTDARMLRELNDKLSTVFEDMVTKARSGYWIQSSTYSATVGRAKYRIPHRSVVGGLESLEINDSTSNSFYEIPQIPVADIGAYEGFTGRTGLPVVYAVVGDQIQFIPAPSSVIQYKFYYYIRPSQLVASQNAQSGTDRGRITSIAAIGSRQVTVNAIPFDQNLTVPAAITSGSQSIDIVHPNGWHELSLVGATQTYAGNVITIGGTDSLEAIEVGDYVRVAEQTDWPCLPGDFHRCLCDATAVKILIELHLNEKSEMLGQNNGNDLVRFKSLLYPRIKSAPKQVGIMRRARGGAWPYGRVWGY